MVLLHVYKRKQKAASTERVPFSAVCKLSDKQSETFTSVSKSDGLSNDGTAGYSVEYDQTSSSGGGPNY